MEKTLQIYLSDVNKNVEINLKKKDIKNAFSSSQATAAVRFLLSVLNLFMEKNHKLMRELIKNVTTPVDATRSL